MDKVKFAKASRKHTFITFLGIIVLAVLMLVNIAGAVPYIYIPNYDSNNVSVINATTNTITATVNVGNNPFTVAVTPNGTKAYVLNECSNTVSVINTTNKHCYSHSDSRILSCKSYSHPG